MEGIFTDFLGTLAAEATEFFSGFAVDWAKSSLYVEDVLSSVLGLGYISQLQALVYGICVALVLLKFLKKGFMIYVLERDGDSELSPIEPIKGLAAAIIIMLMFPLLYDYMADITLWLCNQIANILSANSSDIFNLSAFIDPGAGLIKLIMLLVYFVMMIGIYFSFIKRGAEMLVLRLGFPFATLGLLDSDNGVFKPYVQQFFKCSFTTIVQTFCISMSTNLIFLTTSFNTDVGIFYAIGFLMLAKSAPNLLNQFLLTTGGGGGALNKVSSAAMTVNVIRGFMK